MLLKDARLLEQALPARKMEVISWRWVFAFGMPFILSARGPIKVSVACKFAGGVCQARLSGKVGISSDSLLLHVLARVNKSLKRGEVVSLGREHFVHLCVFFRIKIINIRYQQRNCSRVSEATAYSFFRSFHRVGAGDGC